MRGARALSIGDEIGSIEPDKRADLLVLNVDKPKFTPLTNIPAHVVNNAAPADVETVLVDGDVLMRDGGPTTMNVDAVQKRAEQAVERFADETVVGKLLLCLFLVLRLYRGPVNDGLIRQLAYTVGFHEDTSRAVIEDFLQSNRYRIGDRHGRPFPRHSGGTTVRARWTRSMSRHRSFTGLQTGSFPWK